MPGALCRRETLCSLSTPSDECFSNAWIHQDVQVTDPETIVDVHKTHTKLSTLHTQTLTETQQLNAKRYGTSRKFGYVEPKKEEMPPEVRPRDCTPSPRAGSPPSVFFPARARADVTSRAGIRSDPIWMLAAARRSWSTADVVPRSSLSIPPSSPYVPRSTCARS